MLNDLIKVKDRVAYLLDKYPACRDCDKKLHAMYLSEFTGLKRVVPDTKQRNLLLGVLLNAPTPESITRVRRKLNEQGHYIGESRPHRLREQQLVKDWSRNN